MRRSLVVLVSAVFLGCALVTDLSDLGGPAIDAGDAGGDATKTDAADASTPHGTCVWSHRYGDPQPQYSGAVAMNAVGDIFVSESFAGTVDFGGGPLASAGGLDVMLARYDASGKYLAAVRFGDVGEQSATGIAVNGMGDVFMTGPFKGTLDFGDAGGGVLTANADGQYDVFLVQVRNQVPIWSALVGGPGSQFSYSVAADPSKGALLPGVNQGTVNVASQSFPVSSGATSEAFAAHLLSTQDWAHAFPSTVSGGANAGTYDSDGNIVIVGSFAGSTQLGGATLDAGGGLDIFVAKYDGTGNFLWRKGFGNATDEQANAVATHSSNSIVVGTFTGTINLGGNDLTAVGASDGFVVELDKDGNHVFSKAFGGAANEDARAVAVDKSGNIYIGGFTFGDVDFGGDALKNAGGSDIFLLELDASGNHVFSRLYGDSDNQNLYFNALAVGPDGNVVLTPQFRGTVDFGCGPMTSAGLEDLAVVKLTP